MCFAQEWKQHHFIRINHQFLEGTPVKTTMFNATRYNCSRSTGQISSRAMQENIRITYMYTSQ